VNIVRDRFRGQSRKIGFVDVLAKAEAGSAIEGLNGKDLKERNE
jgi:RNA recognition motif-containing protein